jgi:ribosomal protein L14E/L6E/L27E
VAVLQDGPSAGKIAAIVDVIDQNRVSNGKNGYNENMHEPRESWKETE